MVSRQTWCVASIASSFPLLFHFFPRASSNRGASCQVSLLGPTLNGKPAEYVDVPITAVEGINTQLVIGWKTFKQWMYAIDADPLLTVTMVRTAPPNAAPPVAAHPSPPRPRLPRTDVTMVAAQIELQSVDMFGSRIGFIKFKANAMLNIGGDEGQIAVPGIVFMRGGAVAVLVILECEGKEYTILTYQARVPVACSAVPEIPAGMLDAKGNFKVSPDRHSQIVSSFKARGER